MQKRMLFIPGLIFFLGFVSAYTDIFSIGEIFNSLDPSTAILGTLWVIFFALIHFALSRVMVDKKTGGTNKAVINVISLAASFLATYGVYKSGFDYENLFYSIGISVDSLSSLIPIILVLGVIILLWVFRSTSILVIGILFILIAMFTDLVYEEGALMTIGFVLIIIGVAFKIWWFKNQEKFGHRTLGWR